MSLCLEGDTIERTSACLLGKVINPIGGGGGILLYLNLLYFINIFADIHVDISFGNKLDSGQRVSINY